MIRVHLLPEMRSEGPATACAQIRLLRPYQHRSLRGRLDVSAGLRLPSRPLDVVVMQRSGPIGATLADVADLVRDIRRRGARLVYDLDDDLLAPHPMLAMEQLLRSDRPKIRFLLREADLVTVTTPVLRDHAASVARRCAVVPNGLDEQLVPPVRTGPDGAEAGYFGTTTHLPDLMAVVEPLQRCASRLGRAMRFEIFGVANDSRLSLLSGGKLRVACLDEVHSYGDVHAALAERARWRVGLAPLERNTFNDAKSDIKVLDYAAAGIAAVVADSPVYAAWPSSAVERAPHDGFDAAIRRLLEDDGHRAALVRNARDHLLGARSLAQIAPLLPPVLEMALE